MTKILIESNPYQNDIKYSRYDETRKMYIPITKAESENSKLLSDGFKKCFFPFKAKEILCQIIDEYGDDLEIVFEGSSDEYDELLEVKKTSSSLFNTIRISQGNKYLENGQSVIKQINDIFKLIKPIVDDSVSKENETININLKKYSDASNDIIPICVIGNTNMGKSTFINALLGAEYLPQDSSRCTAKIYKINASQQVDTACIKFKYDGKIVSIFFNNEFKIDGEAPNEFMDEIKVEILDSLTEILPKRISNFLKYLNYYDEKHQSQVISNSIDVQVPFKSVVLNKSDNPFVIFDTPGSNYAGNETDLELLKEQMKNLTNGLPIVVTDCDGLESKDSSALIKELQSLDELDQRFTILVVNKADEIDDLDIKKWDVNERRIRESPIPRLLSNRGLQGIYFVSSIMGLGYKNDGKFIDIPVRTYSKNLSGFDGSESDVINLYKFNILPEQLKNKFEHELSNDINPIYLNSGLYSVEKELETYANVYSAYNKCQQSWLFLQKVVLATTEEINNQNEKIQIEIDNWNLKLSEKQRELMVELQDKEEKQKTLFRNNRNEQIKKRLGESVVYFDPDDLKRIEEFIYKKQEECFNVDGFRTDLKNAKNKTSDDLKMDLTELKGNFVSIITGDKSLSEGGKLFFSNFSKMFFDFRNNRKIVKSLKTDVECKTDDAEKASYDVGFEFFVEKASEVQDEIYNSSKSFWLNSSEELKQDLIRIVVMSNALTDDHKTLLKQQIANYQKLELERSVMKELEKTKYRSLISYRIRVSKLGSDFNRMMKISVEKLYNDTKIAHWKIFEDWADRLLDVIRQNIGELNPELMECQDNIDKRRVRKKQLEQNLSDLKKYYQDISKMISWNE